MPTTTVTTITAADFLTLEMFPVGRKIEFGDWCFKRQCNKASGTPKIFIQFTHTKKTSFYIGYKFRISVGPEDLEKAYKLLIEDGVLLESSFFHFKVTNREAVLAKSAANIAAGKGAFLRLYNGGQFTLYCSNNVSAIEYASFLIKLANLLESNGISAGVIPSSDLPISAYCSGRCELDSDATGALIKGSASTRAEVSKSTAEAYLFHLARLYEIVRIKINKLSDGEIKENAEAIISDFTKKYSVDRFVHDYDLIIAFLEEVGEPLNKLLGKTIDFSVVTESIKPKASLPGYNYVVSVSAASVAAGGGGGAASVSSPTLSVVKQGGSSLTILPALTISKISADLEKTAEEPEAEKITVNRGIPLSLRDSSIFTKLEKVEIETIAKEDITGCMSCCCM